jgi:branched-chain amino acid aminotransferase
MEYLYMVIASPVGPYFSGGVKPVSVWITPEYTRAAPGGTGAAKCGGNYAAGLSAQAEAIENGCDQVVYLDAVERKYVDELGGMNIVFVMDDGSLVTPPLAGTILPGITRDSILTLARRAGRRTEERAVSFAEWREGAASGRIREVFACGTAAVITPIGTVRYREGEFTVADGGSGEVTMALRQELVDIQRGRADDPYGWVHRVI